MSRDRRPVLDSMLDLASHYSELPEDAARRGVFEVGLSSLEVLELVDDCIQEGIPVTIDDLLDLPTMAAVAERAEARLQGGAPPA